MIRWFKSFFAWQTVRDTGVMLYETNVVTGVRRVWKYSNGHQPIDTHWLKTGEWDSPPPPYPPSFLFPRYLGPSPKYGLSSRNRSSSVEHQKHLEILARGGAEADELVKEIEDYLPTNMHYIYMYPHIMKAPRSQVIKASGETGNPKPE